MKLTKEQKEAVLFTDGNALVNSGAGSGKTLVVTLRIANLIQKHGVNPGAILGLTYTSAAAENMRERVARFVGQNEAKKIHLYTFHAFALRNMKQYFSKEFKDLKIAKDWMKIQFAQDTIDDVLSDNELTKDLHEEQLMTPGDLLTFISYQKMNMITPNDEPVINLRTPKAEHYPTPKLMHAYKVFQSKMKVARVYDFDDMLLSLYNKLKENSSFAQKVRNRYDYVIVDEYQDTNRVSQEILKIITQNNLFVVGDFRQGIYGFTNAEINNILAFDEAFDDVELIELNHNFRSKDNIVNFANSIIDASPIKQYSKFSKQLGTRENNTYDNITFTTYENESEEASEVANKIVDYLDEHGGLLGDHCILTRTNAQQALYELEFFERDISVKLSNTTSFFELNDVQILLAYAKHITDPTDDISYHRIYNTPNRYISRKSLNALTKYAYDNDMPLEAAVNVYRNLDGRAKFQGLNITLNELRTSTDGLNAGDALYEICSSLGYINHLERTSMKTDQAIIRVETVERIISIAERFSSLETFLGYVDKVLSSKNKTDDEEDAIQVKTVHSAKGLEFKNVYVVGATKYNYPHKMNPDIEEERRLFYVAVTRAIDNLAISWTKSSSGKSIITEFLTDIGVD